VICIPSSETKPGQCRGLLMKKLVFVI